MSYQAVIRDSNNNLIISSAVGIQISILQGSISGTEVYKEIYSPNPQTNANGLITLEIGTGNPVIGSFATIDWSAGPYFIKTEIDPLGGTNYTITGTTQLLSVPYALHSKTAESLSGGVVIIGATKTKITYDTNGLVSDGADATTADIAASTNRNYVTDAQQVVISNTSGTNSGDAAINTTSNTYADGKVADVITDGVTTVAPSQNVLFNALQGKESSLKFELGLTRNNNTIANNLITGLSGGQTIIGGTDPGDGLIYKSTIGAGTPLGIAHQWLGGTNGSTIAATILNNGNIGIGYSSGTEITNNKLSINGIGYFNGSVDASHYKIANIETFLDWAKTGSAGTIGQVLKSQGASTTPIWSSLANAGIIGGTGTSGYLPLWNTDGTSLTNSNIFNNGGYIGINNTSPQSQLDIVGNIRLTNNNSSIFSLPSSGYASNLNLSSGSSSFLGNGAAIRISSDINANGFIYFSNTEAGVDNRLSMTISNKSSVGIGFSTGTEITNNKLAVNGSGYFNGALTVKSTGFGPGKILVSDVNGLLTYSSKAINSAASKDTTYFIQNQKVAAQNASMWINGVVKGTLLDNGGQVFNVKMYAAIGDGLTDDGIAINNALSNAGRNGGGIVFIPAGTYYHTQTIVIPSNTHLMGSGMGSTIILGNKEGMCSALGAHSCGQIALIGVNNAKVSNLTVDNHTRNTPANGIILVSDLANTPTTNSTIENCEVLGSNSHQYLIWNQYGKHNKILNNYIDGEVISDDRTSGQDGIEIYGGEDILVQGNTVKNIGGTGMWAFSDVLDLGSDENLTGIRFLDNYVSRARYGIMSPVNTTYSHILIKNNIVLDMWLDGIRSSAADIGNINDCQITGNSVKNCTNSGITIAGQTGTISSSINVSGNTIDNVTSSNGIGIQLSGISNVTCNGNTITNSNTGASILYSENIYFNDNNILNVNKHSVNVDFSKNVIVNNNVLSNYNLDNGSYYGINISNLTSGSIINNQFNTLVNNLNIDAHSTDIYKESIFATNKGIGYSTGTEITNNKFAVNGSGYFASTIQATTAKLTNLTDGHIPYHASAESGLTNSPISVKEGYVGMNNANPLSQFDIIGNIRLTNSQSNIFSLPSSGYASVFDLSSGSSSFLGNGAAIRISSDINANGFIYFSNTESGVGNRVSMTISNKSNVGIGFLTGTEINNNKLAVNGTGYFNGAVDANSYKLSGTNTLINPFKSGLQGISGTILISTGANTDASWKTLSEAGIAPLSGSTNYEVPLTFSNGLTRTANAIVNNLITGKTGGQMIIGGTSITDGLIYKSTTGLGSATEIAHQFTGGSNGATVIATMLNNGNLGIGTTAPGRTLDVNGIIRSRSVSGSSAFSADRVSNSFNAAVTLLTAGVNDWVFGERGTYDSNFHLYSYGISTDAMTVLRSSGNIGIGYSTDTEINSNKLAVNGNFYTNGIITTIGGKSTDWNTAYGWGNHAGLYRPVSYVPAWSEITSNPFLFSSVSSNQLLKYNSTTSKWENWTPNFLTNFIETDPSFTSWNKSSGISITSSQVIDFQTSVTNNLAVLANTAKNSFSTADATKLAGIATGAQVNVNADWNATSGDAQILNKPTIPVGTNTGDMQYWNGTAWVVIPAGQPGQFLQYTASNIPTWTTVLPILTTTSTLAITNYSATSGGNIASSGGGTITARGVCWSTSPNPTLSDNKTVDGTGTGLFTSLLNGLTNGTTYYVRAYATNGSYTAYGNEVSFSTAQ